MTTCIIAEKPSVARDIARIVGANNKENGFLEGNGYIVTWAMGHLIALAMPQTYGFSSYNKDDLPITPNPFKLVVRQVRKDKEYHDDPAALKQLKVIRECFNKADIIIVGTDAGREGELIFRWIYNYLNCNKPFKRLWISSLTDKAIREGLDNLKNGADYNNLYNSAQARSQADWLVGINASRALSIARRGAYSLGRVQTPTLAMVCKRFIENKEFKSVPYWKVNASLSKDGILIKAIGTTSFEDEALCRSALSKLRETSSLTVTSVIRKTGHTQPPLLYDLTTLQKEANRQHSFSADKTLSIAQSLYEKKVTTYPRTGSRYISEDIFDEIPTLLQALGKSIPTPFNKNSVNNDKVTDHHAIIPTGETPSSLNSDESIIYQMILSRFLEAFSQSSQEERMQVIFTDGNNTYSWKACHQLSQGWKAISQYKEKDISQKNEETEEELNMLPDIKEGENYSITDSDITQHKTKPKALYTEATLLAAMENAGKDIEDSDQRKAIAQCGIGTPATRANIIETLILRDYIQREKKNIIPTDKGLLVYNIVKDKKIANVDMTGAWEVALEAIECGKMQQSSFTDSINKYTEQICSELIALAEEKKSYPAYHCPKCGNESIGIYSKIAKCNNEGCGFHVFREVCGTFMSEDNIKDLISCGRTPIIKGLVSKSGKKFNAHIILKPDFTTAFEFEQQSKKKR